MLKDYLKKFLVKKKKGGESKEQSSPPEKKSFKDKEGDKKPDTDTKEKIGISKKFFDFFENTFVSVLKFRRNKKKKEKEKKIEYHKKKSEEKKRRHAIVLHRQHKLKYYLEKAGFDANPNVISKRIFYVCVGINLLISAFLIYHFSTTFGITWSTIIASVAVVWILLFLILLFVFWVLFYLIIDVKIFRRKVDIEDVLPDYLQLTASNIKAGMTVDRALWYAVRPRFGVLAKEIEVVAKETMRGEDLKDALQNFSDKYDSVMLKRAISLLIEGIDSGGEIGDLLNRIAVNIQENKIMREEMSANVTTYIIFISFASIAAAPVLFALSGVLIRVLSNVGGALEGAGGGATGGFVLSFSGSGVAYEDFKVFALVSLVVTSFFSSSIISTVKKGNVKSGFKYIPIFMVVSITIFLIADWILGNVINIFF